MLTVDQFVHATQTSAVQVGASFTRPTEDWLPFTHYLLPPEAEPPVIAEGVNLAYLSSPEAKDNLAVSIARQTRNYKARAVALLHSAWYIAFPEHMSAENREYIMAWTQQHGIAEHPLARELLLLFVVTPEGALLTTAEIYRRADQAPVLGAWVEAPGIVEVQSRFLGPVEKALRDVAGFSSPPPSLPPGHSSAKGLVPPGQEHLFPDGVGFIPGRGLRLPPGFDQHGGLN